MSQLLPAASFDVFHVTAIDTLRPKAERAEAFCNVGETAAALGISKHDLSAIEQRSMLWQPKRQRLIQMDMPRSCNHPKAATAEFTAVTGFSI